MLEPWERILTAYSHIISNNRENKKSSRLLMNHFLGIWTGLELPREYLTEPVYPVNLNSDSMELDGDGV